MRNRKNTKKSIRKPATRVAGTLDQHFGDKLRARRVMMVPKLSQSERFGLLTAPSSTVIQASPVHTGITDSPAEELDHLFSRLVG